MRHLRAVLTTNINAVLFVGGLLQFYCGLASAISVAAANVAVGTILMAGAAWPYLRKKV